MKISLAVVLFCFLALTIGSALSESLTYDEVFYRQEGRRIWESHTFSDPYNPPLTPLLAAIPHVGRLVTIAFGVFLIIAVYQTGGPAAATVLAFEPNFLAHSHYMTSDIAVTLFIFLTAMAKTPVGFGFSLGYALSSKVTSLLFLPYALAAMRFGNPIKRPWRLFGSVAIALVVLWASYLFTWDVVIRAREDPSRISARVVTYARKKNVPVVEGIVTFLQKQPMPLGTYAAVVKNNFLRVGKPALIFFDGALYNRSRWYFMIATVLRKMPLPFLILVSLGAWRARRFTAIGLGIIGISSVVGVSPQIRYMLPALPFLALAASAGIRKKILVLLILWQIVATLGQYPHFISYANAFAGARERRYEIFADSNLDWGQAIPDVTRFAARGNIGRVNISYFGRLDESYWRFEDVCAFREIIINPSLTKTATVISVSNWYYCGYNRSQLYAKDHIWRVLADSLLVF